MANEIKPEMVPTASIAAAMQALERRDALSVALAAALNAWPGMYTDDEMMYGKVVGHSLILPLTEKTDGLR